MLLKKTQPWKWEQDQQVAFETLKAAYASQLVLLCPDYLLPFRIECDASKFATGGVLLQDDTNGQECGLFLKVSSPRQKELYDLRLRVSCNNLVSPTMASLYYWISPHHYYLHQSSKPHLLLRTSTDNWTTNTMGCRTHGI